MELNEKVIEQLREDLRNYKTADDLFGTQGAFTKLKKTILETILQGELDDHLGYSRHERKSSQSNSRNGFSKKTVKTNEGEIPLSIPRDRNGEFEPQLIKKHDRKLGKIEEMLISLYARGMSTRDIQEHIQIMYDMDISPTAISHITEKVLEETKEWQSRTLDDMYVIVYFDALFYKCKDKGKVTKRAVYTSIGINKNGEKDVLGLWIHETEGSHFWLNVLTEIKNRGVNDILISCIDGLQGFPEAIETVYPNTEIQTCVIHQIRNSLKYIPHKYKKEFSNDLKSIYQSSTKEKAELELDKLDSKWGKSYPHVIKSWRNKWDNLTTYFKYDSQIRKIIYTTNTIENLHRQLRKVTKNRAVFINDEALKKLLFLTIERSIKKWSQVRDWGKIIAQLSIHFKERIRLDL